MITNTFIFLPSKPIRAALILIFFTLNLSNSTADIADVYVSPEDFPSAPNDTEAIKMAIDDAVANQKIVLLKASKTYVVESEINGKGVSILGSNAVLKIKNSINNYRVLYYDGYEDFFVRDLRIDGNRDSITITANLPVMQLLNCKKVHIENCRFYNVGTQTFRTDNVDDVLLEGSYFTDIGSTSVTNYDAIFISNDSGNYHGNIKINNCVFRNIGSLGDDADAIQTSLPSAANGDELNYITVSNCSFISVGQRCMKFQSGHSIVVANNVANSCNQFVSNSLQFDSKFETICNNVVTNTTYFYSVSTAVGVNHSMKYLVIDGNVFDNGTGFAQCWGSAKMSNTKITNNMVTELSTWIFNGRGKNISMTDNHFEYAINTAVTGYPVILTDGGRSRFENNTFKSDTQDISVIQIFPTGAGGQPLKFNIVRHNFFDTDHNGNTTHLIHVDSYLEPTNILEID